MMMRFGKAAEKEVCHGSGRSDEGWMEDCLRSDSAYQDRGCRGTSAVGSPGLIVPDSASSSLGVGAR